MSGGFKRSGVFGLVGVFVVAALAIAIATTMGQGEANPKLALGLIFGVIAIFCTLLFALQRSDLERAADSDAAASSRAAAAGGKQVDNPTTMAEPELWAALAIAPIDAAAIRARDEVWDVSRRSQRLAIVLSGERHGRQVAVRLGGHEDAGTSEVYVGGAVPEFSARSSDGRVRSKDGAPAAIEAALAAVPSSTRWKRLEASGGAEGIVVIRKKGDRRDWLCDLWLAERLASA